MVYDVITYNGEREVLEMRLNILNEHVDRFVVVEAKTTFSGYKKPLYFSLHENHFEEWWKKIDYHIINEKYTEEEYQLAEHSPNTVGATHWKNEFLQKESILKAIKHLEDNDTVYIGDVDEIWRPYDCILTEPIKLKLKVYSYYLNNRSSEDFCGTLVSKYGDVKNECLNHLRTDSRKSEGYYGWHFTSMGGYKEVARKLNDSYTAESYNTLSTQQNLQNRLKNGIDYLGRDFTFKVDESEWPQWLKKNKSNYKHLCK